ncbi:MAG: 1-aminocyclopropane-1-carboxylate deaminase/D-cysteine desulfhydrase [Bacteroidetes bacterium]|nr:1-aminocyclopropane-1-carboxylate deaminase/D-cysteine desulfhydrase [Bacteroidota bacterium]
MSHLPAPTPLQLIREPSIAERGVELWLKRDDLTHPEIQGNKWRKLRYNLVEAREEGHDTLLTFGGVYSNHIAATAAAGRQFGFKTIGIIRGEPTDTATETLLTAARHGMRILWMDRAQYRMKDDPDSIESLRVQLGRHYYIPEGGTNLLALPGVIEMVNEIKEDYDYICTASGTGGTLAGIVAGLYGRRKAIGFSVLKGQDTLTPTVAQLVSDYTEQQFDNWHITSDYHHGGYARVTPALIDFIRQFKRDQLVQLEPVYTGKLLYGLYDMIGKGDFPRGTKIIAVHTGGLQGLAGYREYFPAGSI